MIEPEPRVVLNAQLMVHFELLIIEAALVMAVLAEGMLRKVRLAASLPVPVVPALLPATSPLLLLPRVLFATASVGSEVGATRLRAGRGGRIGQLSPR